MTKKLISLRQIEKITNGDSVLMKELLAIFTKEATAQIRKIEDSQKANNWPELKNVSHKVKSSMALIGLETCRALAEEVERSAGNDPQKTQKQVSELLDTYRLVLAELHAVARSL